MTATTASLTEMIRSRENLPQGDDLDLTTLDFEAYWTSGETYAALGYDTEPLPVPSHPKTQN